MLFQQATTASARLSIRQGFRVFSSTDKMTGQDRSRWIVSTRKLDVFLAKEKNTLDLSGTTVTTVVRQNIDRIVKSNTA